MKSIINDLLVEFPQTTKKDMMCIPGSHIAPQANKLVVEKLFKQYHVIRVSLPFLSQDFGGVSHREVQVYWSGTILHYCNPFLDPCNNFQNCLTLAMFKFCLIYWWSTIKSPSSKWKEIFAPWGNGIFSFILFTKVIPLIAHLTPHSSPLDHMTHVTI